MDVARSTRLACMFAIDHAIAAILALYLSMRTTTQEEKECADRGWLPLWYSYKQGAIKRWNTTDICRELQRHVLWTSVGTCWLRSKPVHRGVEVCTCVKSRRKQAHFILVPCEMRASGFGVS